MGETVERKVNFVVLIACIIAIIGIFLHQQGFEIILPLILIAITAFLITWAVVVISNIKLKTISKTIITAFVLAVNGVAFYSIGVTVPLMFLISFGVSYVAVFAFWALIRPKTTEDVKNKAKNAFIIVAFIAAFVGIFLYRNGYTQILPAIIIMMLIFIAVRAIFNLIR